MSRIALELGFQDRILVDRGRQLSQASCEDVVESIAGAIPVQPSMEGLYAWTLTVFEKRRKAYRDVLVFKLCGSIGYYAHARADFNSACVAFPEQESSAEKKTQGRRSR